MKKLREVVYKALVDNLGVQPHLLSRIEGDDPIGIELVGGEEIFIHLQDNLLQTFVEIPVFDQRVIRAKSQKIMELLFLDESVFMNLKKDKLIMISEFPVNTFNAEIELADKLRFFNNVIHQVKN
ncbi:hypothetical protein CCZ37_07280 [Vibrio qinghaiensis]|jgi:hypothetical protein|uniref:Uncharacterized protein n=1 Tax=Vibrio qinghaiensis TaxID=2025808 RepID=A0A223MY28_9VIBR|nr:hypothetical protein [Vibrio qinghaiensis]ASU22403.1 hypothetical protein CCZ37_07280 [Vibrio qinghaiensis]